MRNFYSNIILVFAVSFTLFSNIFSSYAVDIQHGESLFTANCSACHSGGNNVIMPEKTLRKGALSDNQMNNKDAIGYQVTNGKNAMPAFGGRLSDVDIEDVANFVLSQSEKDWD
ncbi:unnamed protein product [Dictyota dichotoma]